MAVKLHSISHGGLAVVLGVTGGVGGALYHALHSSENFERVLGFSRTAGDFDLTSEQSIADAAAMVRSMEIPVRLVVIATGLLQDQNQQPEKSWRQLDADKLARSFAVNATGPALVAKHFLPLLARDGKTVFAAMSAKVGSIGDNRLGGWYAYRAAKAALNQLIRTTAIELRRTHPEAICVTLHPGTVTTRLSAPYISSVSAAVEPVLAAERLLIVIDALTTVDSGTMVDHTGEPIPW